MSNPDIRPWHQGWGKWAIPGTIECFTVVCDQTQEKFTICRELPDCFSCGDPPSIEWDCLGEEYACIIYDQLTYEISGPACWDGPAGTPTPAAFVLIENTQCVFRFDDLTMPDCSNGIIDDDLDFRNDFSHSEIERIGQLQENSERIDPCDFLSVEYDCQQICLTVEDSEAEGIPCIYGGIFVNGSPFGYAINTDDAQDDVTVCNFRDPDEYAVVSIQYREKL